MSETSHAEHEAAPAHNTGGIPATLRLYMQVEGEKKPQFIEIASSARLKDVLEPGQSH